MSKTIYTLPPDTEIKCKKKIKVLLQRGMKFIVLSFETYCLMHPRHGQTDHSSCWQPGFTFTYNRILKLMLK